VKPHKLYDQLRRSPHQVITFREFERMIHASGFRMKRQKGSHRSYRHPVVPRILTIQPAGKDAERYQVDLFMDMVEEFGLEFDS
jgi:predicted RNA binding protein YcfA (HicA-like mRNA interferase family)